MKNMKTPGPDHPIRIEASAAHVVVNADMSLLRRSDHVTYCP
jgi:hypothetical protein